MVARPPSWVAVRSLESGDGVHCVDVFRRADGTFCFEEYRRDPEDPRGWSDVGDFGDRVYATEAEAVAAARATVPWLRATS